MPQPYVDPAAAYPCSRKIGIQFHGTIGLPDLARLVLEMSEPSTLNTRLQGRPRPQPSKPKKPRPSACTAQDPGGSTYALRGVYSNPKQFGTVADCLTAASLHGLPLDL